MEPRRRRLHRRHHLDAARPRGGRRRARRSTAPTILARTPGLDAIATVEAVDWGLVPASHLSFAQMLDLAATVRATARAAGGRRRGRGPGHGRRSRRPPSRSTCWCPGRSRSCVTGAMRTADDDGYDGPTNLRDAVRLAAAPEARHQGAMVVIGWHDPGRRRRHQGCTRAPTTPSRRPTTARWAGSSTARAARHAGAAGGARCRPSPTSAVEPIDLVTHVVGQDGRPLRLALARRRARHRGRRDRRRQHPSRPAGGGAGGDGGGHPGRADDALAARARRRRPTPSPAAAHDGSRPARSWPGHSAGPRRASRSRWVSAPGWTRRAAAASSGREPRPPDLIVLGRIASLAGEAGFGWLEGLAVLDGRIVAAGRRHDIAALAGAGTRTMELAPGQVALPVGDRRPPSPRRRGAGGRRGGPRGRGDARGRARAIVARRRTPRAGRWRPRWLAAGPRLGDGRLGGAARRPPTSSAWRPGRRIALWAHDHHTTLAERGGAGRSWASTPRRRTRRRRGRPRCRRSPRMACSTSTPRGLGDGAIPRPGRGGDRRCAHAIRRAAGRPRRDRRP